MFILTNFNLEDKILLDIKKEQDTFSFTQQIDNITIIGKEKEYNCNFYVLESTDEDVLNLTGLVKSTVLECEVVYETGIVQNDYNVTDLIKSFGSKHSIERLRNVETDGYLKSINKKVSNKIQILPKIQDSSNLLDIFLLEDMFNENIIKIFSKINIENVDLLDVTKRFYDGAPDKCTRILLLDALLKLLNFKFITDDVFDTSSYSCLIPFIKDDIENRRLSKISRDKLIIKVYILILQLSEGKVKLSSVPSFNQKIDTVISYFRLLGCIYNRNTDEIKLVNKPMEYIK